MHIGVKLKQNQAGGYTTDSFVVNVSKCGSDVRTEFVYVSDGTTDQESGWVVLSLTEARELAMALIAIAEGYTQEKRVSFLIESGKLTNREIS